jgi:DNA-binding response OmpR family regulator
MIAIVSSIAGERAALLRVCETQGWPCTDCDSVRALLRMVHRIAPQIVVVRQKLDDGYSDDVIAVLANLGMLPATKVIVLAAGAIAASVEARQVSIGADCIQRDPVRIDILAAYIGKYLATPPASLAPVAARGVAIIAFSGASLDPLERTLQHDGRSVGLTPREVTLIELLTRSSGEIVTYETLYSEILERRFRGDTSNMRVLLGKLSASAQQVGIALREWVDVIPKTGYRYRSAISVALNSRAEIR